MNMASSTSPMITPKPTTSQDGSVWSGTGSRLNSDLPINSTDRWPEPMQRGDFQVPMELWNVLGRRRLLAAENVHGPKNLSQAERRELEETWTMVQTDDVRFDRYPPEAIPRIPQSINFIPVRGPADDNIESHIENIDEDEEFFRQRAHEKSTMKDLRRWFKRICCLRKPESPEKPSPSKPAVRTFKVNHRESPPTPEMSAQGSVIVHTQPPRRLVRHSLMADYVDSYRPTESGRSTYSSGRYTANEHPIYNYNPIGHMPMSNYSPTEMTFPSYYGRRPSSRLSSTPSANQYSMGYGRGDYDGTFSTGYQYRHYGSTGHRTPSGGWRAYSPRPQANRQRPPQVHAQRFGAHVGGHIGGNSHERQDGHPSRPYHVSHTMELGSDEEEPGNISGFSGIQPAALLSSSSFPPHMLLSSPPVVPRAVPEVPKHEPNPGMAMIRESTSVPRLGIPVESNENIAEMQRAEIINPTEDTQPKFPWLPGDLRRSNVSFQSEIEEMLSFKNPSTPMLVAKKPDIYNQNHHTIDEEISFDENLMDHGLTPRGM